MSQQFVLQEMVKVLLDLFLYASVHGTREWGGVGVGWELKPAHAQKQRTRSQTC